MRTKLRWVALLMVMALVLVACGDDDDTSDTTEPTTTTTTAPPPETTPPDDTGDDMVEEPTTTTTTAPPTTTEEPMDDDMDDMMIATDIGVDLEAGTITIGMLSDLTGAFGPLVSSIVNGHEVYWEWLNENGGIHGLQVELEVRDTQYVVDNHVQLYEELKDQVVAFGHSTGSPHTVAINADLQADGILAIPLTWYSGWTDPALNANLMHHGAPYCIEAMNMIQYMMDDARAQGIEQPTLAISSLPGDYGLDSAAGAALAAEALGLEVVYDGSGTIIPTDESSLTANANAIVESGADLVWITATPSTFSSVYGQAIATGYVARWSGASPNWNPALVAPDSAIKDALARDFFTSAYYATWFDDNPGSAFVREQVSQRRPDLPPLDYYGEGFIEAVIMHQALLRAYENGDMTQRGVLAAAKSLESVDFMGMAPAESYVGSANDQLTRAIYVGRPDPEGLAAGTSTGITTTDPLYVSPLVEGYVFESACYQLS